MHLSTLQAKIYELRNQKVMLDFDLALLYDIETKVLNQSVKRHNKRFPADFMFQLSSEEYDSLRSQFVTLTTVVAESIKNICHMLLQNKESRCSAAF